MTHPVRPRDLHRTQYTQKPWACVKVRREKNDLIIQDGVSVLKVGALLVPVPSYLRVVSDEGELITPSKGKQFWISTESFDPFHLVTEM